MNIYFVLLEKKKKMCWCILIKLKLILFRIKLEIDYFLNKRELNGTQKYIFNYIVLKKLFFFQKIIILAKIKVQDIFLKGIREVRLDNQKVLCKPGPRTKYFERLFFVVQ